MSKPFVCSGCRVRLALRPRAIAARESGPQRRDFLRPASNDQTATQLQDVREHREHVRRQRTYEEGLRQIGLGRSQPATGGRYSGQPLRPQHLLQELGESKRPAHKRPRREHKPTNQRSTEKKLPDVREVRSSSDVAKFGEHILQREFVEAWNTLRQMHAALDDGVMPQFDKAATKKLHQLMRRIVVDYSRDIGGDSTGLPTPWEFVQLVKKLGLASPAMRSELLWRLGNGLVMKFKLDDEIDPAEQARAFQQITLLWHDTLETKLAVGSSSQEQSQNDSILPWSFLPSPESVTKDDKGAPRRLEEALACVLPNGEYSGWSEAVADYQSAMFITLDLLNTTGNKLSWYTWSVSTGLYWKPMLVFFDGLLQRVIKPDVPPTIRVRLEQSEDPVLRYYEAMVRRFDFANLPPIRTDRSKALRDMPLAKLDELGRPVIRRPTVTSAKSNVAAAATQDAGAASQSTYPVVALDKVALREAGFSVQENFDMDSRIHYKVFGWVKRLHRSIETSNLLITEACWDEARKFNSGQSGASSLPLFLYEHFMLAFLALRQPRLAVEAWNAVTHAGIRPTVKTWTVMMRGCSRANDPDTMEKFWARMKEQGVQPDRHAWSVRLFTLIKAGRLHVAFPALKQMGQEWVTAVRLQQRDALPPPTGKQRAVANLPHIDLKEWNGDVGDVPRPSLAIVNSMIAALASKSDEHIPRVLAWAREFAIDFDLTTYNTLLNVAMRHGQMAEALSIIKHMEKQSIQPDSTTITVILAALFKSDYFTQLPAEEQTTKLFALIASIESSSPTAKLDLKGYALAIDRMLKEHDNPAAARALLEHMSARGFEPTSHIYTILMTSYFDADPPDFAAAEALWAQLQSSNAGYGASLDTIFYDRMVESYARYHHHVGIAPMMDFLARMSREGKRPRWPMLELVAKALADREEWGMLHGLVDDIRGSKGLLRVGVRGLVGQNEFWRYIISTGMLDKEGVRSEQDLRIGTSSSSFHSLSGER